MKLQNETALITGSTSGIGKKMVEVFLREGCKVAICSRNKDHIEATLKELKPKFGDNIIGMQCDVSNPTDLANIIGQTVLTFGSLRILVANAGFALTYGPFEYLTPAMVDSEGKAIIGTNLLGMMNSISAVLPQMKKQKYGRIITLSGGGADRPLTDMTLYSASKGGVLAFSKCLALELKMGKNDIKLNILQPGMQRTGLTKKPTVVSGWRDPEAVAKDMELVLEYLGGDLDRACLSVLPYVIPSCKVTGKVVMGFSLFKLIRNAMKLQKAMKNRSA
jgi:3-oxoacyl-[acyl-carrier protein] reductase